MKKSIIILALLCSASLWAGCVNSSQSNETTAENTYNAETTTSALETENSFEISENTEQYTENELSDFLLSEPEHIRLRDDINFATFNFDDNELIALFDEAWYIRTFYFECLSRNFFDDHGEITDDSSIWYTRSGVSYDSFVNFLNNYFTNEYTNKLLYIGITEYDEIDTFTPYSNINGELCYKNGYETGTNPALDSITVNITEQTNDTIVLTTTARYCHPDTPDEEYFNNFDCIVKMTENGWRIDYFKLWYWGENTEQSSESIQQTILFRLKAPYSYTDDEMTTILFEDEDLKNKLDLAFQLKYGYIDRTYPPDFSFSDECIVEYAGINDRPYCRTNIDYNSFIETFKMCFTDKCIDELFMDKKDRYINDNGTLMLEDINGLQNSPCNKELTFDISEQTEDQLTLHGRAKVYHPDDPDEIAYYDYYFLVLMTEQGWKFDTFDNSWLYSTPTYDLRLEMQE